VTYDAIYGRAPVIVFLVKQRTYSSNMTLSVGVADAGHLVGTPWCGKAAR
jgi:hypothetical protein